MSADQSWQSITELFEGGERLWAHAEATDASLIVTDRRVAVAMNDRLALVVPFDRLRRVEFDIEPGRPPTLILVPDTSPDEPQVLVIPPDQYEAVGRALAFVAERLAPPGQTGPQPVEA